MLKSKVFLGIDTSCYTTSVAMLGEDNKTVHMAKKLLEVAGGQRGLRQSEMVFAHTRNLPSLMEQLDFSSVQIQAIAVSSQPRSEHDSYMPAFLPGKGLAQSLAQVLQVPLYMLSHQENHMYAGLWSSKMPNLDKFLFVHISGGTTEIILVEAGEHTLLSATKDISAGQFVDRIGVKLGTGFPAGAALEKLAECGNASVTLPVAVQRGQISFSGPCSAAMRMLDSGSVKPQDMAVAVQECLAVSLFRSIRYFAAQCSLDKVLVVGGVACNSHIKQFLYDNLKKMQVQAYFAQPEYSADNALGCAVFARNSYNARNNLFDK